LKNILVTGCAGFIGSTLVDSLLSKGYQVFGIDNFSTGRMEFLDGALANKAFKLFKMDLLDSQLIQECFDGIDIVFHLAANADVRFGTLNPRKDLEQNTLVTFNVLEAMRIKNVKKIVFSSTGSIYGESPLIPTPENAPFPVQTSLYGASKLACEGLITSYCEGFDFQSWIFRFVSILGERYTHGHVIDFFNQLIISPNALNVLGNGKQRKSYLYVQDCINAMMIVIAGSKEKINIFNLGVDDYCEVNDSIGWICDELGLDPKISYVGGDRGWVGDNPFIYLDTKKINGLGWKPTYGIQEGVLKTIRYLKDSSNIKSRLIL
jgi:UDP-glucose 4-epimerase